MVAFAAFVVFVVFVVFLVAAAAVVVSGGVVAVDVVGDVDVVCGWLG